MGKYGCVALRAVNAFVENQAPSIVKAWEMAAKETFATVDSQTKSCPRSTFLGVCETGLVNGVPAGRYNVRKVSKNKQYGLNAITVLAHEPALANDPDNLWSRIGNSDLRHNSQMDVIITLWKHGLIRSDV